MAQSWLAESCRKKLTQRCNCCAGGHDCFHEPEVILVTCRFSPDTLGSCVDPSSCMLQLISIGHAKYVENPVGTNIEFIACACAGV